jgi:hypothetical protein
VFESGLLMRNSYWTPSIVPDKDQDACLVIEDLGKLGLIYRESDVETADVENVIEDLLDGQYSNPIRVISFNVGNRRHGFRATTAWPRPLRAPPPWNGPAVQREP